MSTYIQQYDPRTGRFLGVLRDDGALIPRDLGNRDWQQFLSVNALQVPPLSLSDIAPTGRMPRQLWDIYADLQALTPGQKTAVWSDLSAGSPRKYLTNSGRNEAAIGVLHWAAIESGAAGASLLAAKLWATAAYCQDNPGYLIHPAFDPSITIPGDQPVGP